MGKTVKLAGFIALVVSMGCSESKPGAQLTFDTGDNAGGGDTHITAPDGKLGPPPDAGDDGEKGGDKLPGDDCEGDSECKSGECIYVQGAKVCAQDCIDECPDGFICQESAQQGADTVYVCVSLHGSVCMPCGRGHGLRSRRRAGGQMRKLR